MKNMIRSAVMYLLFIVATMAQAAVPAMNVTVSGAGGKAAFKGATDAKGVFATGKLQPGNYIVQFTSTSAAVKSNRYALVISAGAKKVTANAVAGEKFAAGGVAMKIDVGAGLNISGQVANDLKTMTKDGKKMVWIAKQLGSNRPGHWVEADSAEAREAQTAGSLSTKNIQDRQAQGISPGGH